MSSRLAHRLYADVGGVAGGVLHLAPRIFGLAFHLLGCALRLGFRIPGPFANLTLNTSGRIVYLPLTLSLSIALPPWV